MDDFNDPGDLAFFDEPDNDPIDWDTLDLINEHYEPAPGEETDNG